MTFDQFTTSTLRNAWLNERGLALYVRRAAPYRPAGINYELANLYATCPGNGRLTCFLNRWEPHYGLMVDCIINMRLYDYLIRRGYVLDNADHDLPTVYKLKDE